MSRAPRSSGPHRPPWHSPAVLRRPSPPPLRPLPPRASLCEHAPCAHPPCGKGIRPYIRYRDGENTIASVVPPVIEHLGTTATAGASAYSSARGPARDNDPVRGPRIHDNRSSSRCAGDQRLAVRPGGGPPHRPRPARHRPRGPPPRRGRRARAAGERRPPTLRVYEAPARRLAKRSTWTRTPRRDLP